MFGKFRCNPLLDFYVHYQKPYTSKGIFLGDTKYHTTHHKAGIHIHSKLYSFNNRHTPKVATKELKEQINSIDKQIDELQNRRYALMEENWSKCKKLGIPTAQEYEQIRKTIIDKYKEG